MVWFPGPTATTIAAAHQIAGHGRLAGISGRIGMFAGWDAKPGRHTL
jgi:hypothetical protein